MIVLTRSGTRENPFVKRVELSLQTILQITGFSERPDLCTGRKLETNSHGKTDIHSSRPR
jgi:hypothetical protein